MDHQTPKPYSASGYDLSPLPPVIFERRVRDLTPEERRVLLASGTETPFCGGLLYEHGVGTYVCRLCALPLFRSQDKFESGTGWPSFMRPFDPDHLVRITDTNHGMTRTEIRCVRCQSHLGHVFPDGPPPTGERHCVNSVSLRFMPDGARMDREEEDA